MTIEAMKVERLAAVEALLNVCVSELLNIKKLEGLSIVPASNESAAVPDADEHVTDGNPPLSPSAVSGEDAPSSDAPSPGTAAVSTSASPATPAESGPGATPGKAPTLEEVRAAIIPYTRQHGADKAMSLLKKTSGTDMLPSVPAEKLADVLAAFVAANKEG